MADDKLQTFVDDFKDALGDALSLQVLTFTGTVEALDYSAPSGSGDKKFKFKWEDFFENAVGGTNATLSLVAATQVMADGDTILFVAEDAKDGALHGLHVEATAAAQQYRRELVSGFLGLFGK